ncbi:MAG: catechol 2,3-dioxygenase-like lactoylglutathione lyase family enzyme [Halieaceae bacterium]|jgi:catechol 2,3-dioxygenase-like lactoylglutathione lyase family enzyme
MIAEQLSTPLRLDHLAIWVDDMDKTSAFLTDIMGWKRHPMVIEVSENDPTVGGMEAVFFDCNGLWLELILPTAPGPGMDILKAKGVQLMNIDGTPLEDNEKYHVLEPYGEKIAYFPNDVACGMTIEVLERGPRKTSIMHRLYDTPME